MSSPAASLRKTKKSPLPSSSSRGVAFRIQPRHGFAADELLGAREERIASQHHQIVEGIRREDGGKKVGAPSDTDLVASMASRLAQAERELLAARRDILEKVGSPVARVREILIGPPPSRTIKSGVWKTK